MSAQLHGVIEQFLDLHPVLEGLAQPVLVQLLTRDLLQESHQPLQLCIVVVNEVLFQLWIIHIPTIWHVLNVVTKIGSFHIAVHRL